MIRRVSSRQRLVSWDAFDATANHGEATSSSSEEEEYCIESIPSSSSTETTETTPSRKRERSSLKKKKKSSSSSSPKIVKPLSVLNASSTTTTSSTTSSNVPAFPWEFASLNPQPIDTLPEDVLLYMCSFLDLSSIVQTMALNHKYRHLLLSADSFWMTKCRTLWEGLLPTQDACLFKDSTNIPTVAKGPNCQMTANLPLLISMTPDKLPFQVDETMLGTCRRVHRTFRMVNNNDNNTNTNDNHRTMRIVERQLTPDEQDVGAELIAFDNTKDGRRSIQYTGRVGAGDRCIRSNHPLPRPTRRGSKNNNRNKKDHHHHHPSIFDMLCRSSSSANSIQGTSCLNVWRPFVAPYVATDGKTTLQVGPRMVSYFEVSILPNPKNNHSNSTATATTSQQVKRDCVAVGVATESFSCSTRMPGWDAQSFGYHGDDGGTFHASGAMLERFGPCFGTGDTVGCGIDYVARGIFFTLNGTFLGYGWKQIDSEFLEHDLYGVVGIDTNDPVTVNYGNKPFQFNLSHITNKHDKLIAHQYQHSKTTTTVEEDSELADLPSYPEI